MLSVGGLFSSLPLITLICTDYLCSSVSSVGVIFCFSHWFHWFTLIIICVHLCHPWAVYFLLSHWLHWFALIICVHLCHPWALSFVSPTNLTDLHWLLFVFICAIRGRYLLFLPLITLIYTDYLCLSVSSVGKSKRKYTHQFWKHSEILSKCERKVK